MNPAGGLAEARYSSRAHDLVRFVADPIDDVVADFVSGFVLLDGQGREAVRASLREGDLYTLMTFSRRRAADALRQDSLPLARQALSSVCAVTRSAIDFRDLSIDFPLYAVAHLGGDVQRAVESGIEMSESGTAAVFAARTGTAPKGPSLRSCGLRAVESAYGLGFIWGYGNQQGAVGDLVRAAIGFGDALDADGTYQTIEMHLSNLPGVWFNPSSSGRPVDVDTSGCVAVRARVTVEPISPSHGLLIFLAQVTDSRMAVELAGRARASSTESMPRVAVTEGNALAVLIAGTWMTNRLTAESIDSLARYEPALTSALRDMRHPRG